MKNDRFRRAHYCRDTSCLEKWATLRGVLGHSDSEFHPVPSPAAHLLLFLCVSDLYNWEFPLNRGVYV